MDENGLRNTLDCPLHYASQKRRTTTDTLPHSKIGASVVLLWMRMVKHGTTKSEQHQDVSTSSSGPKDDQSLLGLLLDRKHYSPKGISAALSVSDSMHG